MLRRDLLKVAGAGVMLATVAGRAVSATAADLAGDIAIVRQALTLHPGLYRYATPAEVEARLIALERDFVAAPDLTKRYLALSRFLAQIKCGHSYCNFFNQSKATAAELFERPTRLPAHFRWLDGRMIVIADHSGIGALPPGTEVRTVNGIVAQTMLRELLPYARADGSNDGKRLSLLSVRGSDRIETFDVFHGLIYGPPAGGAHQLTISGRVGERTIEVPAIGLAARRATMGANTADGPIWQWQMRDDAIALLTMPSWALYNSEWNWQSWLDDRLATLSGARGLIVDLRANEGGRDCGDALLARLARADIAPAPHQQRLRFQRTPAALDRYLDTWDDSFRTLGVGGNPLPDGFFERPGAAADSVIAAKGPRLTLPVAALIGPANSSATFQFAATAKAAGLVRLFGETSGGNQRGINGGCFFFVRLPASGIEFDLPLVGYFPVTPQPDAGVEPDVRIVATADDIADGRDPAMAAAASWITRA